MTPEQVAQLIENQSKARTRAAEKKKLGLDHRSEENEVAVLGDAIMEFGAVTIDLPLPPAWNAARNPRAIPPPGGKGKWRALLYISKEAKDYVKTVRAQCEALGLRPFPRDQMLSLSGEIRMARAGCDIDGRLKIFSDSLNGLLFEDDEQIARHDNLYRVVDPKNPGITATFTPIDVDRYGKRKAAS